MGFYRKRPVEIEAWQLTGTSTEMFEVYQWVESFVGSVPPPCDDEDEGQTRSCGVTIDPSDGCMVIRTLEGDMKAQPGDWIIKEPFPTDDRRFYPAKDSIFRETYEEV